MVDAITIMANLLFAGGAPAGAGAAVERAVRAAMRAALVYILEVLV